MIKQIYTCHHDVAQNIMECHLDVFLSIQRTCISSYATPPEVKRDLLNAYEKSEKAYGKFRKSRLGEKSSKDFYDRQSKL